MVVVLRPGHVIRIARACVRHGVALTPRGGGTGNYGQAVPLHGGVLIDFSAMTKILWSTPGVFRVEAGAKMHDIDAALRVYEEDRRPKTARIVLQNRSGGPEVVVRLAEERAPHGFDDIESVIPRLELERIAATYKKIASADLATVNG